MIIGKIRIPAIKRLKFKFSLKGVLFYSLMILFVSFTALPLIYMISTAFKPLDELFIYPPRFFVRKPTLNNFSDLVMALSGAAVPFLRYVFNSVLTTVATVVLTVIISCMGAYALGKHKLPGSSYIFAIIIASLMFSPHVTQIPSYMIVNSLNMVNTYWALIIPKIAVAFNLFLLKQFIEQLPDALLEAARIDGANEWTVFWNVVMPFLRPAWSTLIVFSFVGNWNDFFTPLIYTASESMKTLPLAMQTIAGGGGAANISRAGAAAATTFLMTLPTIIVFTVAQRKVIQTLAHSGIKG